jgi:hypothetical protein
LLNLAAQLANSERKATEVHIRANHLRLTPFEAGI